MANEPVTLGELARRIDRLDVKLSKNIIYRDTFEAERRATEKEIRNHEEDIRELKENNRWLIRTMIAMMFTLLLNAGGVIFALTRTLP